VERSEVRERLGLVVVVGAEPETLVVINGSAEVEDTEQRFVPAQADLSAVRGHLLGALGIHPIEAVVADDEVLVGPQADKAFRVLTARTGTATHGCTGR
jgi:hypothetical protein